MKIKVTSIFLIVVALFFTACENQSKQAHEITVASSKEKVVKKKMNKYTLTTTTGEKITLDVSNGLMLSKQLNGKMVLINFWAPWCKPCVKEMPSFVELQEKYKDDFVILGVLFDKKSTKEEVDAFLKKFKVNFPIVVGEENFKMAKGFGDVQMIPESFLYTKDGLFLEKFIGEISREILENHIKNSM